MSKNTVNIALYAMRYDTKTEACGHSFRVMARGALVELGLWSDDAIERQLSHLECHSVRAAYTLTSEHLKEPRVRMPWWANYLDDTSESYLSPFILQKNQVLTFSSDTYVLYNY